MAVSFLMQMLHRILSVWELEGRFEGLKRTPSAVKALVFCQTGVLSDTMLKRVNGMHVVFTTASERAQQSASASSAASVNPAPPAITSKEMGAEAVEDHLRQHFRTRNFFGGVPGDAWPSTGFNVADLQRLG